MEPLEKILQVLMVLFALAGHGAQTGVQGLNIGICKHADREYYLRGT